jgi:hypothetical protein
MKKKMENCSNGDKQVRIKNNVFIEEEKNWLFYRYGNTSHSTG